MNVNEDECRRAELDPEEIVKLANRLSRTALELKKLGITIFGGSGSGSLRKQESPNMRHLILSYLDGDFDGGDGGTDLDGDGLERGEC